MRERQESRPWAVFFNQVHHRKALGCLVATLAVLRLYKTIFEERTVLILDPTVEVTRFSSRCTETNAANLPIPVILISRGRSGSTSTWGIMSNLTGQETPRQEHELEPTGGTFEKNKEFFKTHQDETWLVDLLCQKRKQLPTAGVVGMKWKLRPKMLRWPGVQAALRFIATSSDPLVKIVRSRRNILDAIISAVKHMTYDDLPAHCKEGEEECLENYRASSSGIYLPTDLLVSKMRHILQEEYMIDELLEKNGILHVSVSYEKLYGNIFGNESAAVAEWKRVFEFLGRGPTNDLTFAKLQGAQSLKSTVFFPAHNMTLSNYDEVQDVLSGTELEGLLH